MTTRSIPLLARTLGPALLAAAVLAAPLSASAAVSDGDAIGVCKQKIREVFGDTGNMRLKRIRKRSGYMVELVVNGIDDKPITAKCEVSREGALTSFEHNSATK